MDGKTARRKLIEIARRRHPIGAGSDLHQLMRLARSEPFVDIDVILHDMPYVVVGGIATRRYMPERFTKDIDVLVPHAETDAVAGRLRDAGWNEAGALHFPASALGLAGSTWRTKAGDVDVMSSAQVWCSEACAEPRYDASGSRIVALPYLVLMKLDAGRTQDTADISRMLAFADSATIEQTRDVLRRFGDDSEVLDDLESLLMIGRWELGNDERP